METKMSASKATSRAIFSASIVYIVLAGLVIAVESAALGIQGRWFLAGLAVLLVPVLGTILLTVRRESVATQEVLARLSTVSDRNEKQLTQLAVALLKHDKSFAKLEKRVHSSTIVEGELWRAAIALPNVNQIAERKGYLAAVVIVKDEGPYLREWLEFHRLVGVEHIYLYNNGSSDNSQEVLSHFSRTNYVTQIPWSSFVRDGSPQRLAYAHALSNFGPAWRWMALIDLDEFLFPTEADALPSVLARCEHLPALAAYWRVFSFSGHEKRPAGLVIENYTMRAPFPPEPGANPSLLKFKSIVDPSRVAAVVSPHVVMLYTGEIGAYTEDGVSVSESGAYAKMAAGQLRLNHYYTKSEEEWQRKLLKGSGAGVPNEGRITKNSERAKLMAALDLVQDKTIHRFLPELRRNMADQLSSTARWSTVGDLE